MMNSTLGSRPRLLAGVLMVGAASGVGVLAMVSTVQAQVVYPPVVGLPVLSVGSGSPGQTIVVSQTTLPPVSTTTPSPTSTVLSQSTTSLLSTPPVPCAPGSVLTISFDGTPVGTTTSGAAGVFSTPIAVPAGALPGQHLITVSGPNCNQSSNFTVVAAAQVAAAQVAAAQVGAPAAAAAKPAVASTSTLPLTGRNVVHLGEAGAGLALVGGALVLAARRRREPTNPT